MTTYLVDLVLDAGRRSRERPAIVACAWLVEIASLPLFGLVLFCKPRLLNLCERRIASKRTKVWEILTLPYELLARATDRNYNGDDIPPSDVNFKCCAQWEKFSSRMGSRLNRVLRP